jgi:cytochrome b6
MKILQRLRNSFYYDNLLSNLSHKLIPNTRKTFWYLFGGVTLFFAVIQFLSGFLLLIYYSPTPNGAYESVSAIINTVPFGWLIRSIHSWSANLLMIALLIHFGSAFFMGAYRSPRESVWLSGVMLLFIMLGFVFSGSLLPWDMRAYFATQIGTEIPRSTPLIGTVVVRLLRGSEMVGIESLRRLFALHVSILPLILFCFIALHLILNHKHGPSISDHQTDETIDKIPFYPEFILRDIIAWSAATALLMLLALLMPVSLGPKADPYISAPAGIKPEWYFYPLYMTLRILPGSFFGVNSEMLVNCVVAAMGLIFLGLPFINRTTGGDKQNRIVLFLGAVTMIYFITMTIIGFCI